MSKLKNKIQKLIKKVIKEQNVSPIKNVGAEKVLDKDTPDIGQSQQNLMQISNVEIIDGLAGTSADEQQVWRIVSRTYVADNGGSFTAYPADECGQSGWGGGAAVVDQRKGESPQDIKNKAVRGRS